jgi:hypothetical protein
MKIYEFNKSQLSFQLLASVSIAKRCVFAEFAPTKIHFFNYFFYCEFHWFEFSPQMAFVAKRLRLRQSARTPSKQFLTNFWILYLIYFKSLFLYIFKITILSHFYVIFYYIFQFFLTFQLNLFII